MASPSSLSSSPSFYPSSQSSLSPLLTPLSSQSLSHRPSDLHARDHLESLITKHGHPTPVSLSSLRDLTATSSAYNPPSPLSRPTSPFSGTDPLSTSTTRPIPIPKPTPSSPVDDLPVTPLTGRFDKGYYFPQRGHRRSPAEIHPETSRYNNHGRHGRRHSYQYFKPSRMRSDSSTFYSPVVSPTMSPSGRSSPQPSHASHARSQNTAKSVPSFHLGNLPRFHPAVYQQSNTSQTFTTQQPPSPRQTRQHTYRTSSGSQNSMWQYRELVESVARSPTASFSQSPSAPRLDPLRSPGPVTPLALEEANGYLASGSTNTSDFTSQHASAAPDLVDRLIARENERTRQKARKAGKSR